MKTLLCLILVIVTVFSCLITCAYAAPLPDASPDILSRAGGGGSGGGSSGGGGGSSSGSSSGHTHHYHSGNTGKTNPLATLLYMILFPLVVFSSSIVFYFQISKRSRKAKKLMKAMQKSDQAWKFKDISASVEESYFAIQNAWADGDMTPAVPYMSADLLENFQIKLNWMKYKNQKNVMEKIRLIRALPVAVHDDADNSKDHVWFYIKGKMTDYILDTQTHLVVEGSTSPSSFVEFWKYIRKDDRWVLDKILQKNEEKQIPYN